MLQSVVDMQVWPLAALAGFAKMARFLTCCSQSQIAMRPMLLMYSLSTAGIRPADTEDIAEHARRVTRAEEQVVRSARNVYALNQQVQLLQDELGRVNLRSAGESKKVTCI